VTGLFNLFNVFNDKNLYKMIEPYILVFICNVDFISKYLNFRAEPRVSLSMSISVLKSKSKSKSKSNMI
jgi:hypothetical protein